jgi:hypothetical protein
MKADMEVKMVIALDKGQTKGGVKVIKPEGGREEEKEVIVRREIVCLKWKSWNYDSFSRDWNKKYSV